MTGWAGNPVRTARGLTRQIPGDPDSRTVAVVTIALAFMGYRAWLATRSGFGYHHGWNEGHYALVAHGFLDHPLVPRYGSNFVYSVPPLFPYLVAAGFALLGESVLVARLPSILAAGTTILATYWLGRVVYEDRSVAALGAGLLALLPYVQLYGGRAQTDMLMTCLLTAALAAIIHGYDGGGGRWLVAGGGLFAAAVATKQPAVLLAPIVLLWLLLVGRTDREAYRRTAVLVVASLVALGPLFLWWFANYQLTPVAFVADWSRELFGRTAPFANVPLLLGVGLGLGLTPAVAGLAGYRLYGYGRRYRSLSAFRGVGKPSVLLLWIAIYGAFVLYRTPRGHTYYLLALTPPVALLAARGYVDFRTAVTSERLQGAVAGLVLLNAVAGTVVLLELSGEYSVANGGGETIAPEISDELEQVVTEEDTVLVMNEYYPVVRWYLRSADGQPAYRSFYVDSLDRSTISHVRAETTGTVFIVYPAPSWQTFPVADARPWVRTEAYRFAMMSVVPPVDPDSKFVFYLADRRLVVYRFESNS